MQWMPRSGKEQLVGCVWLGRLIDKARRHEALKAQVGDLIGAYMFGNTDYLDAWLLRFLRLDDVQIRAIVNAESDDERAARRILDRAGRSSADCDHFNRGFLWWNAPFLSMIDADEGRMKAGFGTTLLLTFYERVVVPPATLAYRLGGRLRRR